MALHVVFHLSINRSSYGEDCRACQGITCQTTALRPAGHPHIKTRTHHFKTRTPSRNQEPAQLHMALPLGLPGTTFLDIIPPPCSVPPSDDDAQGRTSSPPWAQPPCLCPPASLQSLDAHHPSQQTPTPLHPEPWTASPSRL